ncbi:LppA family lipoprotein [Nocardia sp. NPDC058658]|uniref:LppA family lipoprotein n=1 Tax=Nocardia sp. NPDC058658 TaxID=3346580 RepID=UPI00364C1524
MGEFKKIDNARSMRVGLVAVLVVLAATTAVYFGPWIWALVDIESDKSDERQATEKFVAEMQGRSSFESVDARSKLVIDRIAAAIIEGAPTVAFPEGPSSGVGSCPRYITDGKRINGRSQVGTRKIPDDVWILVRERVIAEAQALEIPLIEVDDSTPGKQSLRLSDVDSDFGLGISNTNPQARAIISVSTDCHLPAAQLSTSIRPTS